MIIFSLTWFCVHNYNFCLNCYQLVKQYYNSSIQTSSNRYPILFLSIKVPPDAVDVNLEPNKYTVLLKDNEGVLRVVTELLEQHYSKGKENVFENIASLKENSTNDQALRHSEPDFSVIKQSDNSQTDFICAKDMLSSDVRIGCNSVLKCSENTDRSQSCKENTQYATVPGEELKNNLGSDSSIAVLSASETEENGFITPQELVNGDGTAIHCSSLKSYSKQMVVEEPSCIDWADGLFNDSFDIDLNIPSSSTCVNKSMASKCRLDSKVQTQCEHDSTDTTGLSSVSNAQVEFSWLAALNEGSALPSASTGKMPSEEQENTNNNNKDLGQTQPMLNTKSSDQEKIADGTLNCESLLNISDTDLMEAGDVLCDTALSDETTKSSDLVSCEGNVKEPAAEEWSRGHGVVDKHGKPLKVIS